MRERHAPLAGLAVFGDMYGGVIRHGLGFHGLVNAIQNLLGQFGHYIQRLEILVELGDRRGAKDLCRKTWVGWESSGTYSTSTGAHCLLVPSKKKTFLSGISNLAALIDYSAKISVPLHQFPLLARNWLLPGQTINSAPRHAYTPLC